MEAHEKTITLFTTRMRQMILRYKETAQENETLKKAVAERDANIVQLEKQLSQARRDYDSLKTARMLEVSDGDMEAAKKRLAALIREVDKCITLLSEK